jgi:hypothetical protein
MIWASAGDLISVAEGALRGGFWAPKFFSKKVKEGVDSLTHPARFIRPSRHIGDALGSVLRQSAHQALEQVPGGDAVPMSASATNRKQQGSTRPSLQPLVTIFESVGPVSHKQWKPDGSYTKQQELNCAFFVDLLNRSLITDRPSVTTVIRGKDDAGNLPLV